MWFLYILQSESTGKFYTGVSPDPGGRLKKHNDGKGAKFTRAGRPWRVVYLAKVPSKSDALKREWAVKKLSRCQKISLIQETLGRQMLPAELLFPSVLG
jgi:putative endonuclease